MICWNIQVVLLMCLAGHQVALAAQETLSSGELPQLVGDPLGPGLYRKWREEWEETEVESRMNSLGFCKGLGVSQTPNFNVWHSWKVPWKGIRFGSVHP